MKVIKYFVLVFCLIVSTATAQIPVRISVNTSQLGYLIPDDFIGFSFETRRVLYNSPGIDGYYFDSTNKQVITLFKQMGVKSLRIGGGSVNREDTAIPTFKDIDALFRFATGSFATVINDIIGKSGWQPQDVRWVVPHQANGRILKAVARKSGIPFERIYLNIEHVGNTSSASIPLALLEIERGLQPGDRIVLCSVGAGITAAALSVEW